MKAVVMYPNGELPQYTDVPEPIIQNDNELMVSVRAVSIKQLDRGMALGKHYASDGPKREGRVVGGDGICLLADGTRVYGMGVSGMLAEKAIIHSDRIVPVPQGLDDATAAALPNAVFGAALALKFKANIQPGAVVLVNGATGVTGRIAVQLAKYYGAQKVIVTGRDPMSLNDLLSLGADETISVLQDDEHFTAQLAALHAATPFDVVIDYLWGHTAGLILGVLKGKGLFTHPVSYVSVGSMAGDQMQLSSAILRSVDLQLTGSGLGSWSKEQVGQVFSKILPETFLLAAEGKLKVETVTTTMAGIADLWKLDVRSGRRLVAIL